MSYFNYNAKAKKLIAEGHLTDYKIVDNWNGITPALVLYFDNNRPMPIRENRFNEYFKILKEENIMIKTKAIIFTLDEFSEWLQKVTNGNADMIVDGGECCLVGTEDIDIENELYGIMSKSLDVQVTDIIADSNNFKVAVICE